MGLSKYFFDSYAIIEIIKANPGYLKYLDEEVLLTVFNLAEIYFFSLSNLGQVSSDIVYDKYKRNIVEIDEGSLKEAMKFRHINKKRSLSYADCVGYVYALRNGLLFLTGDKEFEGLKNVEFVK